MDDDTTTSGPTIRVVKVKPRSEHWKLFGALLFAISTGLILYISRDSSVANNLKDTASNVFGVSESELVEVIDLRKAGSLEEGMPEGEEEMQTIVVTGEDETVEFSSGREAGLYNLQIVSVIFDVDGSDLGEERVIIKNIGNSVVQMGGGSIQYLAIGDEFAQIRKKNFEADSSVGPALVFVVGMNCHADSRCSDVNISWSEALGNTGGTVFVIANQEKITGSDDLDIVARYDYVAE